MAQTFRRKGQLHIGGLKKLGKVPAFIALSVYHGHEKGNWEERGRRGLESHSYSIVPLYLQARGAVSMAH